MRTRPFLAALVVLLGSAWSVSAQNVSVEFKDGRVRLSASNVPVSRILAEWARVGGTKIVNGERVPGAPVTLQLEGVTEQQAIDILLRGAAGYMVGGREAGAPGASMFDRILVLPTTTRIAATPAAAAPPPPPPVQVPQRFPDGPDEVSEDAPEPRAPGGIPNRFPGGRVQPNTGGDQFEVEEDGTQPGTPPPVAPGNPFGVLPGGSQPGSVSPVVPRTPNTPNRAPQ